MVLLFIPLIYGNIPSSGGGGSSVSLTYTYEECNELLDNQLEYYKETTERANQAIRKANRVARILALWIVVVLSLSVIYILIVLGMNIQQIKDNGFKKWWKSKWGKQQ